MNNLLKYSSDDKSSHQMRVPSLIPAPDQAPAIKELFKAEIIDTNPHLRTKKKRRDKVAKSQSASHKIEGINVSRSKIKRILRDKNGSIRRK